MSAIKDYLQKKILVLTTDGRILVGKLEGFDQLTNLIISDVEERIITPESSDEDNPSTVVKIGTYLLRGNFVATIGLVDEELDNSIDWTKTHGKTIYSIRHAEEKFYKN